MSRPRVPRSARLVSRSALLLATLIVAACSESSTPTAPTPPTPAPAPPPTATVSSVVVAGTQMNATTYQLKAEARLSDGSSRDVTTAAQWQTSNTAVAQVSSSGLVTALHDGTVEVRATYENVTGVTSLTVSVPLFSVRGIVSEAPPSSTPLEGVRINITSGPNQGQFTYSDDRGIFAFSGLRPGAAQFAVSRDNYQPWTQQVTIDRDITGLAVVLTPIPATAP